MILTLLQRDSTVWTTEGGSSRIVTHYDTTATLYATNTLDQDGRPTDRDGSVCDPQDYYDALTWIEANGWQLEPDAGFDMDDPAGREWKMGLVRRGLAN